MSNPGLIARVKDHPHTPASPDTSEQLARLESLHRCRFPAEFRMLYKSIGSAELFDSRYRIMPLTEIQSIGAPPLLAFCDVKDGTYAALDVDSGQILECDPRDGGRTKVIATDVAEFLERLLESREHPYWRE
jgi:SMI1/KNR4 family protein SUKH-1